jgi:hypothetical protein
MNIDTVKITSVLIFFVEASILVVIAVVLIQASRKNYYPVKFPVKRDLYIDLDLFPVIFY